MRRLGFTIIELIVVLGIVALFLALFFPAVQMVRAGASRVACGNNLRQIGLALHMFHDDHGRLPHVRLCPAPWCGGQDPLCRTLTDPSVFTSPNEQWWAPYDNRPGTNPTLALGDYAPTGLLWKYVGDARVFQCPEGIDNTHGSPTVGRRFQVSYALNAENGGRALLDVGILAWDHCDLPACNYRPFQHWSAFPLSPEGMAHRHFAPRHGNVIQVLYRDGAVLPARWAAGLGLPI